MTFSRLNSASLLGRAAASTLVLIAIPGVASAQETTDRDRIVTIGLGPQIGPAHLGSDDLKVFPLPYARIRRPGEPLPYSAADDSPSIRLIDTDRFSIGPTLNFRAKRKERDVGAPVGNVGIAVEPGVFVEIYPVPVLRFRAEARRGVTGHGGFTGDIAADYVIRSPDRRLVAGIGPRIRLGDVKFERRYFGVDSLQSAFTGLPQFDPDGGVHAYGVQAAGHYQLTDDWGVYALAGYDRLVGNGSDSPIVREYGARNQFYAGVAATYSFRLRL